MFYGGLIGMMAGVGISIYGFITAPDGIIMRAGGFIAMVGFASTITGFILSILPGGSHGEPWGKLIK